MFRTSSRAGDLILLIGMVGRDEDGAVRGGAAHQAARALALIEQELAQHGAGRGEIRRIRIFMTDVADWPEVRETIEAFFSHDCPPAIAMAVTAFVAPEIAVELEVDAVAPAAA